MLKNKTGFMLLLAALPFFKPSSSFSQRVTKTAGALKEMHHESERTSDPYLPNAFHNKMVSPAYHYRKVNPPHSQGSGTTITTTQVNVAPGGLNILFDAGNETNIAVNPLNKNEIVIGWRQFDNVTSSFRQAGWSYSTDAGQTWTFPGVIEPGIFRSDPVLDYDKSGNFYYNSLTNSPDFFCKVFKSTDGGASWDLGTDAQGGDKQCMSIDCTAGVGNGNIYSSWTSDFSTCLPGFFTRSTDGNTSYESCTEVDSFPFWGTMAIGNAGELYIGAAMVDVDTLKFGIAKSVDAQVASGPVTWNAKFVDMDGNINSGLSVMNPAGLLGQVSVDVDRSTGPGSGNVYLLASLSRISNFDQGDVMFSRSTDGGQTWSPAIKVNDDASEFNTQWFGTMSVAPTGRIDAVWLDTREDHTGTDSSALYYSYSYDQGITWSANEKLSDVFDPHVGYPNQDKMGDYFDMISDSTGAHLAWANTLNNEEDVYYSYIVPPLPVGMNEISETVSFSVFPNPTNGTFTITGNVKQSQLDMFTVLSERVFSTKLLQAKNELDISSLPAGIYFLKITNESGRSVVKKLIKE
jgi:hypothetical protein